jgi:hypothetical protein
VLTVQSLAGWELAVLASVRGATGTLEERDRQVERSGMYGEYPAILSAYLDILQLESTREHERPEALKRAVFIAWCAGAAPRCLTGIGDLSEVAMTEVFSHLDSALRRERVDEELAGMVAHYHAECAAPFDIYGAADAAARADAEGEAEELLRSAAPSQFAGRGQMGDYWARLVARP